MSIFSKKFNISQILPILSKKYNICQKISMKFNIRQILTTFPKKLRLCGDQQPTAQRRGYVEKRRENNWQQKQVADKETNTRLY